MDDSRPEETDDSPNDILTGELAVEQESFSQEVRVSWETDRSSWIVGAYYLHDEAQDNTAFDILRDLRGLFVGNEDCLFAPAGNPTGFCPDAFVFKTRSGTEQDITSRSVFADTTLDLSEALRLSAGLRYTEEEVEHFTTFFFDEPAAGNPTRPGFPDGDETDFSNISGRAVLDYDVNEDLMLYGGITTGFKAGGVFSTTDGIARYDEEQLVSYEAGFKSTLADGRLRLNGAGLLLRLHGPAGVRLRGGGRPRLLQHLERRGRRCLGGGTRGAVAAGGQPVRQPRPGLPERRVTRTSSSPTATSPAIASRCPRKSPSTGSCSTTSRSATPAR